MCFASAVPVVAKSIPTKCLSSCANIANIGCTTKQLISSSFFASFTSKRFSNNWCEFDDKGWAVIGHKTWAMSYLLGTGVSLAMLANAKGRSARPRPPSSSVLSKSASINRLRGKRKLKGIRELAWLCLIQYTRFVIGSYAFRLCRRLQLQTEETDWCWEANTWERSERMSLPLCHSLPVFAMVTARHGWRLVTLTSADESNRNWLSDGVVRGVIQRNYRIAMRKAFSLHCMVRQSLNRMRTRLTRLTTSFYWISINAYKQSVRSDKYNKQYIN